MELFRQLNPAIVIEFPEGIEGDLPRMAFLALTM
jgi:hypothetical protein